MIRVSNCMYMYTPKLVKDRAIILIMIKITVFNSQFLLQTILEFVFLFSVSNCTYPPNLVRVDLKRQNNGFNCLFLTQPMLKKIFVICRMSKYTFPPNFVKIVPKGPNNVFF